MVSARVPGLNNLVVSLKKEHTIYSSIIEVISITKWCLVVYKHVGYFIQVAGKAFTQIWNYCSFFKFLNHSYLMEFKNHCTLLIIAFNPMVKCAKKVEFQIYRLITKICDWAKDDDRLQFKKYMSDQTVILPKWFYHEGIILGKEQFDYSYTFWTTAYFHI